MLVKFEFVLETSKLRIRRHYLNSVSYVLLHFLTLRLFENPAPGLPGRPYFYHVAPDSHCALVLHFRKKESTIQYGYRKLEIMHECFPKHFRMGTA